MNENSQGKYLTRILTAIIIAAVSIGGGLWAARQVLRQDTAADPLAATRFPAARALQPFSLTAHDNAPFDNSSLQGHWSFLFFGYTHCPDVCPATLSVLNAVAARLDEPLPGAAFVFVSVDPARDTPEQLAGFVTYFNDSFTGVTGTADQIDALTRQLGVMHMLVADSGGNPDGYLVDHTASVFLFDPDGNYHAVFSPPLDAARIATDTLAMAADFQR